MKTLRAILAIVSLSIVLLALNLMISKNVEATIYGSIKGRIIDEITGEGVEGINVGINFEEIYDITNKEGYFKFDMLPAGEEYIIEALVDKEPYYTKMYRLDMKMEKGKNIILKNIIAKRGGAIEGTIKLWDGTPVSFMSVAAYAKNEDPGGYGAHPDKNGNFRISKVPPDMDLLVVVNCALGGNVSRGYGRLKKEGIRVERDKTTKGIDFIIPDDPTEIYGQVTFKDGKPLRALLIFSNGSEIIGDIDSDPQGNYSIKALEPGDYKIIVGYAKEDFKCSGEKEIYLSKGKKIRIDAIISEGGIEFKEYSNFSGNFGTPVFFCNNEPSQDAMRYSSSVPLALRQLIQLVYDVEVLAKANSNCLPDTNPNSVKNKLLNRLNDASRDIWIMLSPKDHIDIRIWSGKIYRPKRCGGAVGSHIFFYPHSLTGECGSLASILFHELMHVAGMGDDLAYPCTKKCFVGETPDPPPWITCDECR